MLNISKNIYSSWNKLGGVNRNYDLPEAEIIPAGKSINERNKLDTITQKYSNIKEYDNVPLPGFTLYKSDRKSWGSVDQTWLIIDPRGFIVRISSQNFEKILHVTGVTEGLIQQKCVWARENTETKMCLIPISSREYIEAVENTTLLENKINMQDVAIGDTVMLQEKHTGVYMGVASLYGPISKYSTNDIHKPDIALRKQIVRLDVGNYYYQTNLKILKVIKRADVPMTREESVAIMNNDAVVNNANFNNYIVQTGGYTGIGYKKCISIHALSEIDITFEEVDRDTAIELFNSGLISSDFGMLMLENVAGNKFLVDYPLFGNTTVPPTSIDYFGVVKLELSGLEKTDSIILADKRRSIWSNNKISKSYKIDSFVKYYKIVKHVKDKTYI